MDSLIAQEVNVPKKSGLAILMVTSEAFPFVKSGGLADVTSSLSAELLARGNDVRLVMPLYSSIAETGLETRVEKLEIRTGFGTDSCSVLEGRFPDSSVPVYFIKHKAFFSERKGLYGSRDEPSFSDNAKRFGFFSSTVIPLISVLDIPLDIVHAHDWQAALAGVFLKADKNAFHRKAPSSVFSIHNIGYQGEFSPHSIHYLGLSSSWFKAFPEEHISSINFLKAGVLHSDMITTVSPSYAEEIKSEPMGTGLGSILKSRADSLSGVLNGIDYTVWNPETDPVLPVPYSEKDLSGKKAAKIKLRKETGFSDNSDRPLVGMVTRLAEQKGFQELLFGERPALLRMLEELDAEFVVLGTGGREYENALRNLH